MSADFSTGLMVSIVGLSITFIALGVFIGVIYLLKAIFPYKPEAEDAEGEGTDETLVVSKSDEEERTAVIAAVVYLQEKESAKPTQSRNPIWTSR